MNANKFRLTVHFDGQNLQTQASKIAENTQKRLKNHIFFKKLLKMVIIFKLSTFNLFLLINFYYFIFLTE